MQNGDRSVGWHAKGEAWVAAAGHSRQRTGFLFSASSIWVSIVFFGRHVFSPNALASSGDVVRRMLSNWMPLLVVQMSNATAA